MNQPANFTGSHDPYCSPSAYDVLGIAAESTTSMTSREIGKAYNEQIKKAKRIPDTTERARRIDDLNAARDLLVRPEDRVLIDFFCLGSRMFADICQGYGRRWLARPISTAEILGSVTPAEKFDDLLSDVLSESALRELVELPPPELYEDPHAEQERWPLVHVEF